MQLWETNGRMASEFTNKFNYIENGIACTINKYACRKWIRSKCIGFIFDGIYGNDYPVNKLK